jgi:hypothetical protein
MPASSGVIAQANQNVGPHGYIFPPRFAKQMSVAAETGRQPTSNSRKASLRQLSRHRDPLRFSLRCPLPAGAWALVTEAGGYAITGGTVDANPFDTDLSSGFYALDLGVLVVRQFWPLPTACFNAAA